MLRRSVLRPSIGPARAVLLLILAPAAWTQALGPPPVPPENPITDAKRVLGKALFWDEQLSSDNTVACGTCHIPSAGGSDPRLDRDAVHPGLDGLYGGPDDRFNSPGVTLADFLGDLQPSPTFGFERQVTPRHSPTNIGAAYFDELFWDGRATSTFVDPLTGLVSIPSGGALESQSLGPILSSVEMAAEGRTWDDVTEKLGRVRPLALATNLNPDLTNALAASPSYPALFAAAFGDATIDPERIAYALATYQRTLVPDQTPWDLFVSGQTNALTSQQRSGLQSFESTSNACTECHTLPLFSDGTYRNIGLRDIAEDNGRQGVTGLHGDRGRFKVPTLRNVGLRSRFFHHGDPAMPNLFAAVFIYNQGGGFFLDNKDPAILNILMSPGTAANITEFLRGGLTDPRVEQELPPFDRPTLRSELGPAAQLSGTAVPGSGGRLPKILADAPTMVGNAEFRVGLHNALGAAPAFLALRGTAPGTMAQGPGAGNVSTAAGALSLVPLVLNGTGSGGGYATWKHPIPDDPALAGTRLWAQWRIVDSGAVRGVAMTEWAELSFY